MQKLEDPLEDKCLYHVFHREVEEVAHRRHPPDHPDRDRSLVKQKGLIRRSFCTHGIRVLRQLLFGFGSVQNNGYHKWLDSQKPCRDFHGNNTANMHTGLVPILCSSEGATEGGWACDGRHCRRADRADRGHAPPKLPTIVAVKLAAEWVERSVGCWKKKVD